MLYAFGFERVGVVVGDLYFVDPNPGKGQEGPEHGVRLELRVIGCGELTGRRVFERELSADPLGWLGTQLADLDALLASAGFPAGTAGPSDAEDLRRAVPEIVEATRGLLGKVWSGELGNPPAGEAPAEGATAGGPALVRSGWL